MKYNLIGYFEETVRKQPNKLALIDADERLTFLEFQDRSILLSRIINNRTDKVRMPILVYLPKSVKVITSFMGILYSGNFYTITDVKFPLNKLATIIEAVDPMLVITNSKYIGRLEELSVEEDKIINIDNIDSATTSSNDLVNSPAISVDPAYVFFTSGSTGRPKGVTISHGNIIQHMQWYIDTFSIDNKTIIGNQGPFYFDLSTPDVYSCVFAGATLVIIPEYLFSFPSRLLDFMEAEKVNFIYWVPSMYTNVMNLKALDDRELKYLKKILFNGEKMPTQTLNYWLEKASSIELAANLYGPTETTVACSYYIVNRKFEDTDLLPIGKACADVELLLLDDDQKLISMPNIKGELYVRGSYLAAGYWDNMKTTNEVFIQNPLHNKYPEKLYRTGDIAYYNDVNELIVVGRRDSQIKHMGHRIELGEIEHILLGLNIFEQLCCLYNKEAEEISLFYVMKSKIDETELKKECAKVLPRYMVPTSYVKLERMPLNANGKVDRTQLAKNYFM